MPEPTSIASPRGTDKNEKPAAIILCGGRSSRMGYPKWKLPLGNLTMLEYIVQQIAPAVSQIVASFGQHRPEIDLPGVEIVLDERKNCGPIEGIRVGLKRLADRHQYAFVTACDTPRPTPAAIRFLMRAIGEFETAFPQGNEHIYAMSGIYRTDVYPKVENQILNNRLRVKEIAAATNSILVPLTDLATVDPHLDLIYNVNSPQQYAQLLERLGFKWDPRLSLPSD